MNNTIENFDYGLILKSSLLNDKLVLSINNINTTLLNVLETIGSTELRTGILGTLHNLQTQIDRLSPSTTIYLLYLDKTSLVFNHNNEGELIPTELTINVRCKKIQGNKTTIIDIPNTFHCTYGYGSSVYTLNSPYTITVEYSSIINLSYLYISLTDSDSETVDVISVPIIIDGINGTNGTSTIIKGNAIDIESGDPYSIEDYYNENPDETILGDIILIDDNKISDGHIAIQRVSEYYDEEREKTTNFIYLEVNVGDGYVIENNRITLPYEGHLFVASERGEYGKFANWRDSGRIAGKTGSSGYAFRTDPTSIIITETRGENDQIYDVPKTITVKANVAGVDKNVILLNVEVPNNTINISFVSGLTSFNIIGVSSSFEGTSVQIIISGTCDNKSFSLPINVYINRLGTTEINVKDDTIIEIAKKTGFYDTGQDVEQLNLIGLYIRNSQENVSILSKKVGNGKNLFGGKLTSGWQGENGDTSDIKYPLTSRVFEILYSSTSTADLYSPIVKLEPNTTYCFSVYGDNPTEGGAAYALSQTLYPNSSDIYEHGIVYTPNWNSENGRYWFVFTTSSEECYFVYNMFVFGYQYLYNPQLEIGSIPTEFTASAMDTTSKSKQTADKIELSITNKLGEVGIKIDGNNREIDITGAKVRIGDEDQTVALFENGKIKADLVDASKVTSLGNGLYTNIEAGKFSIGLINENDNTQKTAFDIAIDDSGNAVLRYYNKDGSLIGMIDPSFFTSSEAIGNTWRPIKLKKVSNDVLYIPSYRSVDLVVKNTSALVFTAYVFSEGYTKREGSKQYNVSGNASPSIFNTKYLNRTYDTSTLKEKILMNLQSECYFTSGIYVPEKAVPFGILLSLDEVAYLYPLYVILSNGSGYTTVSGNSTSRDDIISAN